MTLLHRRMETQIAIYKQIHYISSKLLVESIYQYTGRSKQIRMKLEYTLIVTCF